jgi:FixJ family two-component response regulator
VPIIDIIDDDDAVRDSTRCLLEFHGYKARTHASAEAFLAHGGENAACRLVDHHMPGMTGVELIEFLRAKGDQTPTLMVTGRGDPSLAERLARAGVKLLHKPFEMDDLLGWINQAKRT